MSKQRKFLFALIGTTLLVGSALPPAASAADSGEVPFYLEFSSRAGHSAAPLPSAQQGRLDGGEIPFYYEFATKQSGASSARVPAPISSAVAAVGDPGEVPYYYQFSRPKSNEAMAAKRGLGGNAM
jgi:hypothetical protein